MKAISCYGDSYGKFNLIVNETPDTVDLSSYGTAIFSVVSLSSNPIQLEEQAAQQVSLSPLSGCIIFAKSPFILENTQEEKIVSKLDFTDAFDGKYIFFRYPFANSLPISSYDNYLYEVQTASSNNSIIRTYKPVNEINSFTRFELNRYYLCRVKSGFEIISPDPTIKADLAVGAISGGQLIPSKYTVEQFAEALITKIFEPTFKSPSVTVFCDLSSVVESGTIGVTLSAVLDKGQIIGDIVDGFWSPTSIQNTRSGEVSSYSFSVGLSTGNTNPVTFPNYVVADGDNVLSGSINFQSGPQPLNNRGVSFSHPLSAGIITSNINVAGRRKAFYGVDITELSSSDIRALSGSVLDPIEQTQFAIRVPINATNVVFAYPAVLRDVSSVTYVEMNAEIKEVFEKSFSLVSGANGYFPTEYKVYKYTPVVPFSKTVTYNVTI